MIHNLSDVITPPICKIQIAPTLRHESTTHACFDSKQDGNGKGLKPICGSPFLPPQTHPRFLHIYSFWSAARCTQQFCWCTQQLLWKGHNSLTNLFFKMKPLSLSPRLCFCFFFFRINSSSSCFFFILWASSSLFLVHIHLLHLSLVISFFFL